MDYDLISYLEYNLYAFSLVEITIANYFINKEDLMNLKIKEVSDSVFVSTSTISRFVKKIGFDNYKQFIYLFEKSFNERLLEKDSSYLQHMSLWNNHKKFYESVYKHIASLDISLIRNKITQSKSVCVYGYGEMKNIKDVFQSSVGIFQNNVTTCDHIEQLNQIIKNKLGNKDLLLIFYNYDHYQDSLNQILMKAEKKSIPVIIISTSLKLEEKHYGSSYNLYPEADKIYNRFSSTLYSPYLIFIDFLMQSLERKKGVINPKYDLFPL